MPTDLPESGARPMKYFVILILLSACFGQTAKMPPHPATKEECGEFPCVMGEYRNYKCPDGYAYLNEDNGVLASSIPNGDAVMIDWREKDGKPPMCSLVPYKLRLNKLKAAEANAKAVLENAIAETYEAQKHEDDARAQWLNTINARIAMQKLIAAGKP